MNYLVRKAVHDSRFTTCGLYIPDGFFVVLGMTFDNQEQLKNLRSFGYIVESTELPEGHYSPDGLRVDKWSIRDKFITRTGDLRYLDEIPPEGAADIAVPESNIRPPDTSLRPPTPSIDDVKPAESAPDAPQGVIAAMERNRMPAPEKAAEVSTQSQPATKDGELSMLRTALTAKGIDWHPRNNAATLKAKLESATA